MNDLNAQLTNHAFAVSLWQGKTLLGWYRASYLYPEGLILNHALECPENSIVSVRIELNKHGKYTFRMLKALVHHKPGVTELLWLNQNADLPGMIPYIAQPLAEQNRKALDYMESE